MRLSGVTEGDIVAVDIRGDRFYGIVSHDMPTKRGEIAVRPISNGRGPIRLVKTRQVVNLWRKRKARAS